MILGNVFLHLPYHGLLCSSEMMPSQSKTVPGQKLFFPNIVSLNNPPETKFLTTPHHTISPRDCSKALVLACPTMPFSHSPQEIVLH